MCYRIDYDKDYAKVQLREQSCLTEGSTLLYYIALYADHNMLNLVLGEKGADILATETVHFTAQKQPTQCVPVIWTKLLRKCGGSLDNIEDVHSCIEPGYPTMRSVVHGFLQGGLIAMPHVLWNPISWIDYARASCVRRGAIDSSLLVVRKNDRACSCFFVAQDSQEPILMTWDQMRAFVSDQSIADVFVWADQHNEAQDSSCERHLTLCDDDWAYFCRKL